MNKWLFVAMVAYLAGAIIEGVSTASQLASSAPKLAEDSEDKTSQPTPPSQTAKWHLFIAISTVSICGAFSWPCRLIHRSLKEAHDHQNQ